MTTKDYVLGKFTKSELTKIDNTFVKLMVDNGVSENDISQFLKKSGLSNINNIQFLDEEDDEEFLCGDEDDDDLNDDKSDIQTSVSQWFNNASSSKQIVNGEAQKKIHCQY